MEADTSAVLILGVGTQSQSPPVTLAVRPREEAPQ